jgi:WD40 repeat protein
LRAPKAEVHAATAGYDRAVRLFDITTGKLLKTFAGHTSSVATVVFNPYGNLIISGYEPSPSLHCIAIYNQFVAARRIARSSFGT